MRLVTFTAIAALVLAGLLSACNRNAGSGAPGSATSADTSAMPPASAASR